MPKILEPRAKAPWPPKPDAVAYRVCVTDPKESFYTIGPAHGISPTELVKFNFGSVKAEEINWYLKNYVGCTQTTRDGQNYVFSGAPFSLERKTGVIYLPAAKAPTRTPMPLPGAPGGHLLGGDTFDVEFERTLPLAGVNIAGALCWRITVTVSGSVRVPGGESRNSKFGVVAGKEGPEFAAEFTQEIANGLEINVGGKLNRGMASALKKSDPKAGGFLKQLGDAAEVTVKQTLPGAKMFPVSIEAGINFNAAPFLVRASVEVKEEALPMAPKPPVAFFTGSIELAINFGPSPALLSEVGGAAALEVLLIPSAMVGFIAFGAWYGGNVSRRGEHRGYLTWYKAGYLQELGLHEGITLAPINPIDETQRRQRELFDAGQKDAVADARSFTGLADAHQAKLSMLRLLIARIPDNSANTKKLLRQAFAGRIDANIAKRYPNMI